MGLGGYLTWTALAREILAVVDHNVKIFPFEQHGHFLKIIKSPVFENNSDFFMQSDEEYTSDQIVLPVAMNNPDANYCKEDTDERAIHRQDSHIIQQICECYGIEDPQLKCVLNLTEKEKMFAEEYSKNILKNDVFITIEPFSKSNYTPNRAYPLEKWQKIVDSLCDKVKIVQVGNNSDFILNNVIDCTGKTTFREAAAIIGKSKLFLAAESGLVHAATAVNTKSVVIITGYQSEKMVAYPQNINVNIATHGPCGLKTECEKCTQDAKNHDWRGIVDNVKSEL